MERTLSISEQVAALRQFQKEIHQTAKEKGWWDEPHKTDLECVALMHSELSEAVEELRAKEARPDQHVPQHTGALVEFADTVIRIMDLCEFKGWDLAQAMRDKAEFNKTRPYKHGKKI